MHIPFSRLHSARLHLALAVLWLAIPHAAGAEPQKTVLLGHADHITYLAFLPDGATLLSGCEDFSIRLWDAIGGKEKSVWDKAGNLATAPSTAKISLSGDGKTMVRAGAAQGTIELWDVPRAAKVRSFQAHDRSIRTVTLSRNGAVLVTTSDDELCTWDLVTGKSLAQLKIPLHWFVCTAITADGKFFATASTSRQLFFVNAATGKMVTEFESHPGLITSLALSPDGKFLLSGSEGSAENDLRLWNVAESQPAAVLQGFHGGVTAVAFSDDGAWFAAAAFNISVWDMGSKTRVAELAGEEKVRAMVFSPDGKILAAGGDDHSIVIWATAGEPAKKTPLSKP